MAQQKKHFYWTLFSSTFYLSAFTFGGGYVIVPLMKKKFAEELKWIDEEEMLNLVAIAQSAPGPIAVNTAILVGYKVAGLKGALLSILGTVLPPLITLSIISCFYAAFKQNVVVAAVMLGMQAGVSAAIADAVFGMARKTARDGRLAAVLIMAGAFLLNWFARINVAYIILLGGLLGAARTLAQQKRAGLKGPEANK